jgi:uncharacterized membrane protein YeiB
MAEENSRPHFFDLKIPLGSLLGFYGLILVAYGIFGPTNLYSKSLGINVNLTWGIVMVGVGLAFLSFAHFDNKNSHKKT